MTKLTIHPEVGGQDIVALFNPTQYTLAGSTTYEETGGVGQSAPLLQYVRGGAWSLSLELLFDTYEAGVDVRGKTDAVYALLRVEPTTHRPPIVTVAWGSMRFRAVLESVTGRFTLFLDTGIPVRAVLDVTFKQHVDPEQAPRAIKTESADHVKTHVVSRGDQLSAIAAAEYGDPRKWRLIARANSIDDPLRLERGRRLVVPPINELRTSE